MIVTLYCYNFNNYYNRVLKKKDTLQDYGDYIHYETGVNFNFSDGVDTSQVINTELNPDYVLVVDEQGNINSRWFTIDATYTRNGQHVFKLHRDVLADYWDNILVADTFIEKAIVNDNNPLIYNQEAITTNQIKQQEILIKDITEVPWIVGYIARGEAISGTFDPSLSVDLTLTTPISSWSYYTYTSNYFNANPDNIQLTVYTSRERTPSIFGRYLDSYTLTNTNCTHNYETVSLGNSQGYDYIAGGVPQNQAIMDALETERNNLNTTIRTYGESNSNASDTQNFLNQLNIKTILDSQGNVYSLSYQKEYYTYTNLENDPDIILTQQIKTILNNASGGGYGTPGRDKFFEVRKSYYRYKLVLTPISNPSASYKYNIGVSRNHTIDAPYDLIAMPYGDIWEVHSGVSKHVYGQLEMQAAMAMIKDFGGGSSPKVYDMQLVPYCPLPKEWLDNDGDIHTDSALQIGTISKSGTPDEVMSYIYCCSTSSFTTDIEISIPLTNKKMQNQTQTCRLVSPNYNGQFEFNVAKNGGLTSINIDCTYKPYGPYIHLNPDFNELYGQDFNDARGLICGGEFGLPIVSDAWATYQRNNVNYQNIFDRQVQNMEINNKYALLQQKINAGVGTVSGIVGGATAGGMVGHGIGAGIVAAVGGIASLAGGIADTQIMKNLQNEAMDYKQDLFGMQLQNIQALPMSLSRTTALTYNNKIFPILEVYDCTDEEKKVVAKKIAWNGMTVGAIGKIEEYITNTWSYDDIEDKGYIKGQLIRVDGINEDMHLVNTIADEINKGVYTKWVYNQA